MACQAHQTGQHGASGFPARTYARIYADRLAKAFGVPVVVDNRPGAGANLASDAVAKSPPDGYTLLYTVSSAFVVNPFIYRKLPFDVNKDLKPASPLLAQGSFIVVNNDLPVKSLQELVAYAKEHPGKLAYASYGIGGFPRLIMELLSQAAKIQMLHVPYKAAPMTDVISGQVQLMADPAAAAIPMIKAGCVPSHLPVRSAMPSSRTCRPSSKGTRNARMSRRFIGFCRDKAVRASVVGKLLRLGQQSLAWMNGTTPKVLARHRHSRIKASAEAITKALTGNWREEHLFVLGQALAMYDDIAKHLLECDAKLRTLLAERSARRVDLGKAPKAGAKARVEFDVRQALANWAGVDLTPINGLGVTVVTKLLSEIGPDLSRFASVKHFCSWLGLCPGTKISSGKVLSLGTKRSANRARQALKLAAMSLSHSDSALGAFYRRLCTRMDKPRANTAVAHKLARMVYFMLTRGEAFVDQGQQHYEDQQRQRSIAALRRRATALRFQINVISTAA